jgi:hypothetical protein
VVLAKNDGAALARFLDSSTCDVDVDAIPHIHPKIAASLAAGVADRSSYEP